MTEKAHFLRPSLATTLRAHGAAAMLLAGAACSGWQLPGEYKLSYAEAFIVYVDSLVDSSIVIYAIPKPTLRSGIANIEPGFSLAVSSLPRNNRQWMDGSKNEHGEAMGIVPALGLCSRVRFRPELRYHLTFMGDLRDPKLEDPKAKSFGIYQGVLLDTLSTAPLAVRTGLHAVCANRKLLDER
jgi:hypothetical protein